MTIQSRSPRSRAPGARRSTWRAARHHGGRPSASTRASRASAARPRGSCAAAPGSRPAAPLRDVERLGAGQQFVEQHAERIDVGARVDVEPRHLRLLGRHVLGRAEDLRVLREQRLLGQLGAGRLGDAEVDHLRHRHAVVQRHQHVARLDVAMDDALVVRVLDRLADLGEQFEPLRRPSFACRSTR
jgi:hypothetical protein